MKPAESFVAQPIRSLQTMLRVISKDDKRLPSVIPDGIYGKQTIAAVSAFQQKHGIPVTGITDNDTWDKIVDIYENAIIKIGKAEPIEVMFEPNQVFRVGDQSPYIFLLQSMLTQLSADVHSIPLPNHTGILDETTKEALIAFQTVADLPVTGELNRVTWKHIVKQFSLSTHHHAVYG